MSAAMKPVQLMGLKGYLSVMGKKNNECSFKILRITLVSCIDNKNLICLTKSLECVPFFPAIYTDNSTFLQYI